MKYKPEYAKGEIIVCFKIDVNCNKQFVKCFGAALGYELSDERHGHDYFIYKTKEGQEKKACEKFRAQDIFVDYAELRDIEMESLWESLDQAIDMMRSLRENVPLPKDEYGRRLKEIKDYIQGIEIKK